MTKKKQDLSVKVLDTPAKQSPVKQALIKALVITGRAENEDDAIQAINDHDKEWSTAGAVDPILDPEALMSLYEMSDSLRQNVDAYVTNIEGNGHILKPKIDLEKDDAFDRVKNAMDAAAWADAMDATLGELYAKAEEEGTEVTEEQQSEAIQEILVAEPSDSEVRARMEVLKGQMQREMHRAKSWFRNVNSELSFVDLRGRKRTDEETIGHGCWEAIRDKYKMLRRLNPMASYTVLPVKSHGEEFEVRRDEWVSEIDTRKVVETIRFRRYVQRVDGKTKYFKDLNDPRLVSSKTGRVYMKENVVNGVTTMVPDHKLMKKKEPNAKPATEIVYFAIHSPKTTAGMIRWSGLITAVMGSRAAAVANFAYFENHCVPDAVLLVSGGQLNNESVQRIEESLRADTKGPGNQHRTLVVQATGGKTIAAGQPVNNPDMEWVNLSDFQAGDALFQQYTENNKVGVSSSFRQALLLIGHIPSDLNRATAYAILSLVEKQVYGPLRNKFDWWVNNTLLPSIGITLIEFKSLSPEATNIEEMSKALEPGIKAGAFSPNQILSLYGEFLNQEFPRIEAKWGDVPFAATLSQINLDAEPPADEDPEDVDGTTSDKKTKKKTEVRLKELEKIVSDLYAQKENDAEFAAEFGGK